MVMGFAGVLGFILRRQGVPMAPLVIGMVLGPTLELTLRQGLILTRGDITAFATDHPIAGVLFVITALALSVPILRGILARRRSNGTA
jgi:putative tricarboxylic transport membrane protein